MKTLKLLKSDSYLLPYKNAIIGRYNYALQIERQLTQGGLLADFANGYLYFGLHKTDTEWVFREWAPNATAIYMIGDFNGWQRKEDFRLTPVGNGVFECRLPLTTLQHGQLYKLLVEWQGGKGERIPSYATRVVQDAQTKGFSAQVWHPEHPYVFKKKRFIPKTSPLFIYECHIGMSGEEETVASYEDFRLNILPRVQALGYNCIQIMAIQEHPYYGSFGYHVSNFYAASSRFGTPEELKHLIDDAHNRGIAVIMDLVHSHAVKNELEGLGNFDGTPYQYFHEGSRREHPAWDSLCFNYQKPEVLHFLLSNCKYWMDEYHFDGFRFDGVTSMIYRSHGLGENFSSYADYYNLNQDGDAICYLTLANKLIHQVNKHAITIAEEMSGMPGLATPFKEGGIGFDYRLAMGIPDFWIKTIKELKDEDWKAGHILYEMTNRRADEKTISYAESHDQALVGDKTIIFRLIDAEMYWHMQHNSNTFMVDRGLALHKMIRLITASTINGGYLNFMGNEFGHPEWIDFPRQGNGWSHKYARRQWSLVDNTEFYYHDLNRFDAAMVHLLRNITNFQALPIQTLWDKDSDQIAAFMRGDYVFIFNWNGQKSFPGYGIIAPEGKYTVVLNTDAKEFAGYGLSDDSIEHFTTPDPLYAKVHKGWLKLYLPARSAVVLKKND
ncbi:MAG: alpha-amylase family glycosyl hydrolase [Paludibacter sp.]|nr:alpha-amylase family glycosyl hydrolase [Bacteroidales bacterium]MCM1068571.1 alpha-amylase family glycosyl hydrolase [Prevotella sp.]MCM1353235.1 alpha-amylase family glycosyl hydrolase [Bacteroides sp.]MCM1442357.1 alpha-amylase family glycosyl hydrolase [Muribaculum sp.]MCM1481176.1 alpha-amylase family glycosyl hydrolase [Paludibacter sp.]